MRPSKDRGGRSAHPASALVPPTPRGYRPGLLRGGVLAGATVRAVLAPEPIAVAAVLELIGVRAFRDLYRLAAPGPVSAYGPAARADLLAAVAAPPGVLALGTLRGLLLGIAASLLLPYRASRPDIAELGRNPRGGRWTDLSRAPGDEPAPGALVEGGLFSADGDRVRERIPAMARERGARTAVPDAKTVPSADAAAVRMLREPDRRLRVEGAVPAVARDRPGPRPARGRRGPLHRHRHRTARRAPRRGAGMSPAGSAGAPRGPAGAKARCGGSGVSGAG
ncbi:hypothetical protein J0910_14330 [Nocardiopsis sp. CNT-189]|uniref:hypothetical protein n=1 Tax=Nocardiopsis oceanisediminis TaxID=2816862 RepID=UPI003B3337CF